MSTNDKPAFSTKLSVIEKARNVLRGERNLSSHQLQELYKELERNDQFAYAAEVLLAKMKLDEDNGEMIPLKEFQKLATYIYKDHSLPSSFKFGKALQELKTNDDLFRTEKTESLGLAGGIYKRRWQFDHQFKNLILSKFYYKKGFDLWKKYLDTDDPAGIDKNDDGYTAINYAYINELMAVDKLEEYGMITGLSTEIIDLFDEAKTTREFILGQFNLDPSAPNPTFDKTKYEPLIYQQIADAYTGLKNHTARENFRKRYFPSEALLAYQAYGFAQPHPAGSYQDILDLYVKDPAANDPVVKIRSWIYATIAEAYFGLKNYAAAKSFIQQYMKLEGITAWEIRSFSQQIFSIAYLQQYQKEFAESDPANICTSKEDKEQVALNIDTTSINDCLALFMMDKEGHVPPGAEKPEIKKAGKLGLALSGGGFRASIFHIGVMAALAEKDELRNVEVLSCVSGGSIIGAYYYLKLKILLESKTDLELAREDYIQLIKEIEKDFLKGVQKNLRVRLFSNFISNFRMIFDKHYSRTHRMGELYEKHLFSTTWEQNSDSELAHAVRNNGGYIYMNDLFINPKLNEGESFDFNNDNWKRKNKIPELVLNATSVNTGHNWQFTASWMGEPPGNIIADIDVKPRLRRMYYAEAPERYKKFRLGFAVGASSCVPVMFYPMPMHDLYPTIDLQLIDGGLHDNQGIASLIDQECKNMIISDASGQMPTNAETTTNSAGVFYRADSILQERLRELQFLDIKERNYTTQLNSLIAVHLKNDLQQNPVSWKFCTDPPRTILYGNSTGSNADLTKYGVLRNIQSLLAEIRTDLDSFNNTEAYALMYSGYLQTNYECCKLRDEDSVSTETDWEFLKIKPYLTKPDKAVNIEKKLIAGKKIAFKLMDVSTKIRILGIIAGVLAIITLIYCMIKFWSASIFDITVAWVAGFLIIMLIGFVSKHLAMLVNARTTFRKYLGLTIICIVGFILSNLYLILLNPIYNKAGELEENK